VREWESIQQLTDAVEGDGEPEWAIIEFVAEFVDGFFEEVRFGEETAFVRGLGEEGGVAGGGGIGVEKGDADPMEPEAGPGGGGACGFGGERAAFHLLEESGVSGVVEGADHAGDVAEWGAFEATFAEGTGGFAFEIDDEKVFAGVEDLAEVIVAVDADACGGEASFVNGAEAREDIGFAIEDGLGIGGDVVGEEFEAARQELKILAGEVAHGLVEASLIVGGKGFRGEIGVIGVIGEGEVKRGGSLTEETGGFGVSAEEIERLAWRFGLGVFDEGSFGGWGVAMFLGECLDAVIEAAEGIEGMGPGVFAVGDEVGEDGEAHDIVGVGAVFEGADERWGMGKVLGGEVTADIEFGVDAGFDAAEELEDETIAEDDGGIGLFGSGGERFEVELRVIAELSDRGSAGGDEFAEASFEGTASGDDVEEGAAEETIGGGVEEDAGGLGFGEVEVEQDEAGRFLEDGLGLGIRGEGERDEVEVGFALEIVDLDDGESGACALEGDVDDVVDAGGFDGFGFAAEPASAGEIGQERGFEFGSVWISEDVFPVVVE
jgi:hypothetical protein